MSKMIQIRNVPCSARKGPRRKANVAVWLLLAEIKEVAEVPTLAEFRERLHKLEPVTVEIDSARLTREARDSR